MDSHRPPLPVYLRFRAAQGLEQDLAAFDRDFLLAYNTGMGRWEVWTIGKVSHRWIRVLAWEDENGGYLEPDHRMIGILNHARFDSASSPQLYVRAKMAQEADIERRRRLAALDDDRALFREHRRDLVKDAEAVGTPHWQTRDDRRAIMAAFDRECEARGEDG